MQLYSAGLLWLGCVVGLLVPEVLHASSFQNIGDFLQPETAAVIKIDNPKSFLKIAKDLPFFHSEDFKNSAELLTGGDDPLLDSTEIETILDEFNSLTSAVSRVSHIFVVVHGIDEHGKTNVSVVFQSGSDRANKELLEAILSIEDLAQSKGLMSEFLKAHSAEARSYLVIGNSPEHVSEMTEMMSGESKLRSLSSRRVFRRFIALDESTPPNDCDRVCTIFIDPVKFQHIFSQWLNVDPEIVTGWKMRELSSIVGSLGVTESESGTLIGLYGSLSSTVPLSGISKSWDQYQSLSDFPKIPFQPETLSSFALKPLSKSDESETEQSESEKIEAKMRARCGASYFYRYEDRFKNRRAMYIEKIRDVELTRKYVTDIVERTNKNDPRIGIIEHKNVGFELWAPSVDKVNEFNKSQLEKKRRIADRELELGYRKEKKTFADIAIAESWKDVPVDGYAIVDDVWYLQGDVADIELFANQYNAKLNAPLLKKVKQAHRLSGFENEPSCIELESKQTNAARFYSLSVALFTPYVSEKGLGRVVHEYWQKGEVPLAKSKNEKVAFFAAYLMRGIADSIEFSASQYGRRDNQTFYFGYWCELSKGSQD